MKEKQRTDANHFAASYDPVSKVQLCAFCGEVLTDNNGMQMAVIPEGGPVIPDGGFAEGPVYRRGNLTAAGVDFNFPLCRTP